MNRILFLITSILFAYSAPLHAENEEKRPFVSLLTCSPAEEVYELFGHTALRYCNPQKGYDIVFNYGVFDFNEPGFVSKFVSGETDYMLVAIDYPFFIQEYELRGSQVTEQVLAFDSVQMERFIAKLRMNCHPANRIYRYNYFYNNCTTKARDIIETSLGNGEKIKYNHSQEQTTFREEVHRFTHVSPWYKFGIDLLLGYKADITQEGRTLQFIPSTLMKDIATATIVTDSDSLKPLMAEENILSEEIYADDKATILFTPELAFALLLILTLAATYIERKKKITFWGIDLCLLTTQGMAGALITYMVFCSSHPTVDSNMLLILLNPLPLLILPIYIYNVVKHRKQQIMWLQAATSALFLAVGPFLPQDFPTPIYMFATTQLIRSLSIITQKQK